MIATWIANCPMPWIATIPATPNRYTVEVCTTRYSDSKPMIDGVMMRLLVTVWKLTVAMACATATSAMTVTSVARCWAIRQNPVEPTGIGFAHASRPKPETTARTRRVPSTTK